MSPGISISTSSPCPGPLISVPGRLAKIPSSVARKEILVLFSTGFGPSIKRDFRKVVPPSRSRPLSSGNFPACSRMTASMPMNGTVMEPVPVFCPGNILPWRRNSSKPSLSPRDTYICVNHSVRPRLRLRKNSRLWMPASRITVWPCSVPDRAVF